MRLVVTGAGGWVGNAICHEAARRRFGVVGIARQRVECGPGSSVVIGDVTQDSLFMLADKLRGSAALIHCAGIAHRPERGRDRDVYDSVNRGGTARVLELARRAGIARVVYLSSIAVYDWSGGGVRDEGSLVAATTAYGQSKVAAEQLCSASGLDFRIARLSTVFGPGDRGNFVKLASAIRRGRFIIPGSGAARKSVCPVGLLSELLVDLSVSDAIPHTVLNLALPIAPTLEDICNAYSEICGFKRPRHFPVWALELFARSGDIIDSIYPGFPFTADRLKKLTTSTVVGTSRMQQVWPARRWPDFREALAPSARYYQSATQHGR